VLGLVRRQARFFLAVSGAALALRLFFLVRFPAVVDDSRFYADLATNWLQHGVYGITDSGKIVPSFSRLPGYPAFLAAIFATFGVGNFRAVLLTQVLFDLGTCLLVADLARRMFSKRAAKAAFLLAAICPFLANYAAAALTETLEIFFTAAALDFAVAGLQHQVDAGSGQVPDRKRWLPWIGCGLCTGACILLRPDGGILLAALGAYWFFLLVRAYMQPARNRAADRRFILRSGLILALCALAPLVPWTLRNWHTFHRFEPLAPRYANDADELVMKGFNQWSRSWIEEYTSVQEIYWRVPGDAIDFSRLPNRAFDSAQQRADTAQVFADYNQDHDLTPEIDARFAALGQARMQASRLRYYIWLPALRIADMWLRPRTELLPSDPRWWEFNDDPVWLTVSIAFGLLNLAYVGMTAAGLLRARYVSGIGLVVAFFVLRSLFLGSLENPEPRYTLECYPVVILLAAAIFSAKPLLKAAPAAFEN